MRKGQIVTSNFSLSHNLFYSYKSLVRQNAAFCGYGLNIHVYCIMIEKQVLPTYTNLSRFYFLGTTPALVPNVLDNEQSQGHTHSRESNSRPNDCEVFVHVFENYFRLFSLIIAISKQERANATGQTNMEMDRF